jgi:hypothetical protein
MSGDSAMKNVFHAVAILGLNLLTATAASAQQPPGSYRQTCSNIRFDGRQLSAVCADRVGRRMPTSLMVDNCASAISNDNGQLTCEAGRRGPPRDARRYDDDDFDDRPRRPRPPQDFGGGYRDAGPRDDGYRGGGYRDGGYRGGPGPGMPGGSWHASCKNGQMQGPILLALCANARGQFQQTSADVRACRSFSNQNGNLVCDGG